MLRLAWLIASSVALAAAPTKNEVKPAAAEPKPGQVLFSPNGDGVLDNAIFHLTLSDPGNVVEWTFSILDPQGREIKRFSGKGAPPGTLEWNGKDENNQLIRDGTYQYSLSVITLAGASVVMPPQELICDRQAPNAQVSVEPPIFSPEEGSAKPTAHFFLQAYDASGLNSWLLRIKGGASVKSFFGKGQPPERLDWDGKVDGGDPAANGDYVFTLAVRDRAGNTTTTSPQSVRIDRVEPAAQVEAKPPIFSPNGDGVADVALFQVTPPRQKRIDTWSLTIRDLKGKIARQFDGVGEPPHELSWEGNDAGGKPIADGPYSYTFLTIDQAGNRGLTIPKTLIVDTKPPQAEVEFKPALISPNGDGFYDAGAFSISAQDENGIESYSLEIRNDVGDLKKTFRGETPPKAVDWSGQDDAGNPLTDGKYSYALIVIDHAGNKTVAQSKSSQIDTTPPIVDFSVEPALISPNGDQKEARFHIAEQDASEVESWALRIEDAQGKVVRRYEGKGAMNGDLVWDGRSDDKTFVPDGAYGAVFWTQDKAHNAAALAPKKVVMGARVPDVSVAADMSDFSPNADGVKDAVVFTLGYKSFNKIRDWSLEISDASGVRVRTFSGQGAPPKDLRWGGERDDKSLASDGRYRYAFRVVDEAGNRNETAPQQIQVDTTRPEIAIRASPVLFSPNGDGVLDSTLFSLNYRDESPVGRWSLAVKSESGKAVRTFSGQGDLPSSLEWDGRSDAHAVAPDGSYTFTLSVEDSVGNKSVTLDQIVRIDNAPPEVALSVSPPIFAPKSESGRNRAAFSSSVQDASNLARWSLKISNAKGEMVHELKGEGHPPAEIVWDGLDSKGAAFPDGTYDGRLSAVDEVGNEGRGPVASVTINAAKPVLAVAAEEESVPSLMPEVRAQETDRGLVIPLAAEVLFETGRSEIKPEAFATLDEAAAIVRKYVGRPISIEGHTDNVPIHNADFPSNKELSRSRAESVRAYFTKLKDLDGARLAARGWGEARPVADNATAAGRQKNRRVEIIIEKQAAPAAKVAQKADDTKAPEKSRGGGTDAQ